MGRARHPTHRPQSQLDASTFDPCLFHIHATFWPWFVFLLNRRHVPVNPVCVSGQIQEVVRQTSLQSSVPFSRFPVHFDITPWPRLDFLLNRRHVAVDPVCVSGQIQRDIGSYQPATTKLDILAFRYAVSPPPSFPRYLPCPISTSSFYQVPLEQASRSWIFGLRVRTNSKGELVQAFDQPRRHERSYTPRSTPKTTWFRSVPC